MMEAWNVRASASCTGRSSAARRGRVTELPSRYDGPAHRASGRQALGGSLTTLKRGGNSGGGIDSAATRVVSRGMATKPLPRFTTPGRLQRRRRRGFAADRTRNIGIVLALIGALAVTLLLLGLLGVHVVTEHFRIH